MLLQQLQAACFASPQCCLDHDGLLARGRLRREVREHIKKPSISSNDMARIYRKVSEQLCSLLLFLPHSTVFICSFLFYLNLADMSLSRVAICFTKLLF